MKLMDIVPTVGASPKFAFPQTSFTFTSVVNVKSNTVMNVATVPVQTVAH
jgi:hypothetical protein